MKSLLTGDLVETQSPKIFTAKEHCMANDELDKKLEELFTAISANDTSKVLSIMALIVPEYQPSSTLV